MPLQKQELTLLHFQKALGLTENGLLFQDQAGQPVYTNQALCHIFGASEEEILSGGLERLFPFQSLEKFQKKVLPETRRFGVGKDEIEGINKEGGHFPLSISTIQVQDEQNDPIGFVSLCKDLSEEMEYRRRRQHSEKLAAVGEMLAGVAHELNNPLTSVVGFSELLLRKRVSPEIKRGLRMISSEAIRTSKIVQNLLAVVRSHKPEKRWVGVNGVIQNVLELKRRQLHIDNIRVIRRLTDDSNLPKVVGDYQQLLEVILNLINNAHQAMSADHGKGTLTIQTTSRHGAVVVRIRDTGPGIPESAHSKVFQPFYTTKADGSGLGLNICQTIIREHGGNITFENAKTQGCTFTICLPVAEEGAPIPASEAIPDNTPAHPDPLKIMVVDDEEVILDLQYHLLTQLGHKPQLFKSAAEALLALDKQDFDLILTDMKMPRMSGRKFYTHLEKHHPAMTGKVIFVTGDTMNNDNSPFYKKHPHRVLYKPFILKQLEAAIRQVFDPKKIN
ncbi:MAG: ATP-binding protein [Nitrospiria bacterium]